MIIGTAGHIDHGKTSLVKALTGTDADRLKEEKARGITIDLGFAYWPQEDGGSIGFVDVPGHEDYIHNMLAGVTGVAAVLLVVAANEGIKPQTREHVAIIALLGIRSVVVALTKSDLANADVIAVRSSEVLALLAEEGLTPEAIIPVSTVTGEGLPVLKPALQALRQSQSSNDSARPFRLQVDRVFELRGTGTVVTGSIRTGEVRLEDRLLLSPSGREVRVRGLHAQNRACTIAAAGDRAAINLAGVSIGDIRRGDVLVDPLLHRPTSRFDVALTLSGERTKPLTAWLPIHLHAGSGSWPARLVPLEATQDRRQSRTFAQIICERPIAVLAGDRYILRDASGTQTIGGGSIVDLNAPERNRRKPERLAHLNALTGHDPTVALRQRLALTPPAVALGSFAGDRGLQIEDFNGVIAAENLLILPGGGESHAFAPAGVLTLTRQILARLGEHHAQHPDQPGLDRGKLRLALTERLGVEAFDALVAHLLRRGEIAVSAARLRLPTHAPRLLAEDEALWQQIRPRLSGDERFKPPRVNELSDALKRREDSIRGLFKRLARRGDVEEVAEDHFLLRDAVGELVAAAIATEAKHPDRWFNAAAFRDEIGVGRKMAILILEHFDRHAITIRKGDIRRVDHRRAVILTGVPTSRA